jgi:hypothetical protein
MGLTGGRSGGDRCEASGSPFSAATTRVMLTGMHHFAQYMVPAGLRPEHARAELRAGRPVMARWPTPGTRGRDGRFIVKHKTQSNRLTRKLTWHERLWRPALGAQVTRYGRGALRILFYKVRVM